jgi:hypothetical protein
MKYESPEMDVIEIYKANIVVTSGDSVTKQPSSGEDDEGYEWDW